MQKRKKTNTVLLIILGLIALGIFGNVIGSDNDETTPRAATYKEPNDACAYVIAKGFVKNRLKSPSSADFPFLDFQAAKLDNGNWAVRGHVDAANSFNAMIRMEWLVEMKYQGGDPYSNSNWELVNIAMD